jgi:hypothetical protein
VNQNPGRLIILEQAETVMNRLSAARAAWNKEKFFVQVCRQGGPGLILHTLRYGKYKEPDLFRGRKGSGNGA